MQWDTKMLEIVKRNADKCGIPLDQAKLTVETYISLNVKAMRRFEPVTWINIGKFFLYPRSTVDAILTIFRGYREGKMTRERTVERLQVYLPLHKIAKEHYPLDGYFYRKNKYLAEQKALGIKHKSKWGSHYTKRNEGQVSGNNGNVTDVQ